VGAHVHVEELRAVTAAYDRAMQEYTEQAAAVTVAASSSCAVSGGTAANVAIAAAPLGYATGGAVTAVTSAPLLRSASAGTLSISTPSLLLSRVERSVHALMTARDSRQLEGRGTERSSAPSQHTPQRAHSMIPAAAAQRSSLMQPMLSATYALAPVPAPASSSLSQLPVSGACGSASAGAAVHDSARCPPMHSPHAYASAYASVSTPLVLLDERKDVDASASHRQLSHAKAVLEGLTSLEQHHSHLTLMPQSQAELSTQEIVRAAALAQAATQSTRQRQ
jgi:hypothetical protein